MRRLTWLVLLLSLLLGACGKKGPLYLPLPQAATVHEGAPAAARPVDLARARRPAP